jgi:hypothetical protein
MISLFLGASRARLEGSDFRLSSRPLADASCDPTDRRFLVARATANGSRREFVLYFLHGDDGKCLSVDAEGDGDGGGFGQDPADDDRVWSTVRAPSPDWRPAGPHSGRIRANISAGTDGTLGSNGCKLFTCWSDDEARRDTDPVCVTPWSTLVSANGTARRPCDGNATSPSPPAPPPADVFAHAKSRRRDETVARALFDSFFGDDDGDDGVLEGRS